MLGDDDHNDLDNEPINAADLFGDDLDAGENNGEDVENNAATGEAEEGQTGTDAPPPARKKYRQINRLANLNDLWLVDPKKENIGKVNSYFDKIKFRKGKGQERENLKLILQKYEYYGQQCYPKFCFKDFVEKVEYVSGKRSIKHALQKIRQGQNDDDDIQSEDGDHEDDFNIVMDINNDAGPDDEQPVSPPPQDPEEKPSTPPPASQKPVVMTDEMRDMMRKKREEALAKRKQRLDESFVGSQSNTNNRTGEDENLNSAPTAEDREDVPSETRTSSQSENSQDNQEPSHDEGPISPVNVETRESNSFDNNISKDAKSESVLKGEAKSLDKEENILDKEVDTNTPNPVKPDADIPDDEMTTAEDMNMKKLSSETNPDGICPTEEHSDTKANLEQKSNEDKESEEQIKTNTQENKVDTLEMQDDKMEVDE